MRLLTTNDASRSSLPSERATRRRARANSARTRGAGARRERARARARRGRARRRRASARASRRAAPRVVAKRVARHHRIREEDSARWHAGIGGSGGKAPSDADIFFRGCALFTTRRTPARTVIFASHHSAGHCRDRPVRGRSARPVRCARRRSRGRAPRARTRARRVALVVPPPLPLAPRPPPPPPPPPPPRWRSARAPTPTPGRSARRSSARG